MERLFINGRSGYILTENIICLQVGNANWAEKYTIPNHVEWLYMNNQAANQEILEQMQVSKKKYDVLLLTDVSDLELYDDLLDMLDYYTIIYDSTKKINVKLKKQLDKKMSFSIPLTSPKKVIDDIATYFYHGQYGLRILPENLAVSNSYSGEFYRLGSHEVVFEGNFGENFCYLLSWRDHNYSLADIQKKTELFLEHQIEGDVEIQLVLSEINQYTGAVQKIITFSQSNLQDAVEYGPKMEKNHVYNYQLFVKGAGKLHLGALHLRFSRGKYGSFILGGQRTADSMGHELIAFFYPGDYRPPLCVYFGGVREAEGFEGYYMMKKLNVPFLLFEDLGLKGGAFYRGTTEYKDMIIKKIKDTLSYLGFSNEQLILSGMSMGTHACLYYANDLQPHSVVINKPLVNLNQVAKNQIIKAPQIFPPILDVESYLAKHMELQKSNGIDEEFWQHFDDDTLNNTQFYIVYMINDDYDDVIFDQLRDRFLQLKKVITYKAIPGRHNDNNVISTGTFFKYYSLVINKHFRHE